MGRCSSDFRKVLAVVFDRRSRGESVRTALEGALSHLAKSRDEWSRRLATIESREDAVSALVADLEGRLAREQERVHEARLAMHHARVAFDGERAELNRQLAEEQRRVRALEKERADLQAQLAIRDEALMDARLTVDGAKQAVESYRAMLEAARVRKPACL